MTLNDAPLGTVFTVASFGDAENHEISKLTAMGILPGARLRLLQKKPLPVFQIGCSRFAIDVSLAEAINVEDGDPVHRREQRKRSYRRKTRGFRNLFGMFRLRSKG